MNWNSSIFHLLYQFFDLIIIAFLATCLQVTQVGLRPSFLANDWFYYEFITIQLYQKFFQFHYVPQIPSTHNNKHLVPKFEIIYMNDPQTYQGYFNVFFYAIISYPNLDILLFNQLYCSLFLLYQCYFKYSYIPFFFVT